jgi:hypothetical protein
VRIHLALVASTFFYSSISRAQVWDAAFDLGLRSYPRGAAMGLEGGYGVPVWGDTTGLLYGYTRVGARVQSSGVVNNFEGKLSVFPISFWGLELKTGWGHRRLDDISTLDCARLACSGSVTRTSLSTPLSFGAGPYFGRVRLEYVWIAAGNIDRSLLADENTSLTVRASGDELRRWEFLGGLKWSDDFRTLAYFDRIEAQKTFASNHSYGLIAQKTWDFHTLSAGLGVYESTTASPHGLILVGYSLSFAKGLGL